MLVSQKYIARFASFRSGGGFVVALSVFCATWLAINHGIYEFDAEDIRLNLVLSIEAAFAMPVILMEQARQARRESDRLKEVLSATHEMIRLIKGVAEDVEDIQEEVDRAVD